MKRYLINANQYWLQKRLLFVKLMFNTPKNITTNNNRVQVGTIFCTDIADLQVDAVKTKSNIMPKYSVSVEHHAFVFRGWMAKKLFNHVQSALQR